MRKIPESFYANVDLYDPSGTAHLFGMRAAVLFVRQGRTRRFVNSGEVNFPFSETVVRAKYCEVSPVGYSFRIRGPMDATLDITDNIQPRFASGALSLTWPDSRLAFRGSDTNGRTRFSIERGT